MGSQSGWEKGRGVTFSPAHRGRDSLFPPTIPPTTGPQCRPIRITTGDPSGAWSIEQRRCISSAMRARLRAFSCSVLCSPGMQPVDAMKASLDVQGGQASAHLNTIRAGLAAHK